MPKQLIALFICALLSAFSGANAAPIDFRITFTVENVVRSGNASTPLDWLLFLPTIGQQYYGSVTVDDSILASDGKSIAGKVLAFTAQIGHQVWNPDIPSGRDLYVPGGPPLHAFELFRGPMGIGAPYLGFTVESGVAIGLTGGVAATGDSSFIDFFGDRFASSAHFPLDPAHSHLTHNGYSLAFLTGTMAIARIPEPSAPLLLTIGLLALMSTRRRKTD